MWGTSQAWPPSHPHSKSYSGTISVKPPHLGSWSLWLLQPLPDSEAILCFSGCGFRSGSLERSWVTQPRSIKDLSLCEVYFDQRKTGREEELASTLTFFPSSLMYHSGHHDSIWHEQATHHVSHEAITNPLMCHFVFTISPSLIGFLSIHSCCSGILSPSF